MKNRVEVGDRVRFCWGEEAYVEGVLEHIPAATGDSWIIIKDDGTPLYINHFDVMFPMQGEVRG
jgi:hypothetical protein